MKRSFIDDQISGFMFFGDKQEPFCKRNDIDIIKKYIEDCMGIWHNTTSCVLWTKKENYLVYFISNLFFVLFCSFWQRLQCCRRDIEIFMYMFISYWIIIWYEKVLFSTFICINTHQINKNLILCFSLIS